MTLDELARTARYAYHAADGNTTDAMTAAVLAVLAEVKRAVPESILQLRDSPQEAEHGFEQCRRETLRRLDEMSR